MPPLRLEDPFGQEPTPFGTWVACRPGARPGRAAVRPTPWQQVEW